MLEAIFQEGILSLTLAGLTQWDYGQKLTIKGLTVSSALEVHFSNNAEKEAIVMSATKSGSDIITEIPNVLLEKDKDITAWVYTDDGQSGETIRTIVLKVTPRIKPADYISENNAGKVIDYVAKAEEYASSAQESAEIAQDNAEKVQANTDIVKEILANVPDFDSYEKLAEHNKLLYDGLYVKGETYSGIASNKGVKLHKVVGKTEQGTTNGYQLFDASKLSTKSQGGATVTNNNDGSFTVSGSGNLTEDFKVVYTITHDLTIQLLKVGAIKLNNGVKAYPTVQINFISNGKEIAGCTEDKLFEVTQEMINDSTFAMRMYVYGVANQPIKTGTIKPMLYQDGDGTWEQYTGGKPAPNSDYPMPIENVEIKKINSTGKNLIKFPYTVGGIGYKNTINGIEYEIMPDKGVKVSGTSTGNVFINLCTIDFGNIGFTGTTSSSKNGYIASIKGADNVAINYDSTNNITFIFIQPENTVDTIVYPMVEKSDVRTEWEEPKGYANVETSITLAEGDAFENGVVTKAKGHATFDGSEDENWIKLAYEPYTRYTIAISNASKKEERTNCLCNRGKFGYDGVHDIGTSFIYRSNFYYYPPTEINTLNLFKEWLKTHPLEVEYELVTPTTETIKVPTVPSYNPLTNIWTDNTLTTDIEWELLANSDNSLMNEEILKRIEALEAKALER